MSKVKFEKYERGDSVAVLYSPGFGAGWYSWNSDSEHEFLLFDKRLVELVLEGKNEEAGELAEQLCDDVYTGGAIDLEVMWIAKGESFEIEEYDGSESVHIIGRRSYVTA